MIIEYAFFISACFNQIKDKSMSKGKFLIIAIFLIANVLKANVSPLKTWDGTSWDPEGEPTILDHVIINSVLSFLSVWGEN